MDEPTLGFISYRRHAICNPYSLDQLDRTLAFTDLRPGDRAADLGCGNGFVAAHMAVRHGLYVTAVERNPDLAALAREKAASDLGAGALTVVDGDADAYLASAGAHRLLCVMGAVNLLPGLSKPAAVMAALAPAIQPGGWLLWADPFWKAPPGPRLEAVFGAHYRDLAGWVAAGEAAGFSPRHVAVSADAEWEAFFWTMNSSLEDWAAENPQHRMTASVTARAALLRSIYLEEGRERMGFGLYLFRRSAA
jgi:SAM-dependent methyltransferase